MKKTTNKFENLTSGKFSAIEKEKMNAMMGGTREPDKMPILWTVVRDQLLSDPY